MLSPPETQETHSNFAPIRLQKLADEFRTLAEPIDKVKRLLEYAARLSPFTEADRKGENRVMGCTAQVLLNLVDESRIFIK